MQQSPFKTRRMDHPTLALQRVCKQVKNGHQVLTDITFKLMPGELLFISGESGSGKTSLLKLCGLLDKPTSGQIYFNGENIEEASAKRILTLRRSIGIITQTPKFITHQSVFANLALPLVINGFTPTEIKRRVEEMLERIRLEQYRDTLPGSLSSGEQECLSIARALITHPSLVIADEPTGNVDPRGSQQMLDLLLQANKFGVSLLIATHDLSLIARSKAKALFLEDGCLTHEEYA
jgi:cell division transport system ATP-binding protein